MTDDTPEPDDEASAPEDEKPTAVHHSAPVPVRTKRDWRQLVAFGVLPATAVALGAGAGFLRWQNTSHRAVETARAESVAAARDTAVAMLSYRADTVEQDLMAARDRLTGPFVDSYTNLVKTVVVPGAKDKKISAVATVKAASSVSATPQHAVALLFLDNAVTTGGGAPATTVSGVRVTLDKVGQRWLVSGFDPV